MLSALLDASGYVTDVVKWVSVGAVVLLLGVIALICIKGKKQYDAKHIAFAGICVALSCALSFAKISPLEFGGSITLASFVPVLIYAYVYGPIDGFLVGIIHGLLNFISSPYIHTGVTFLLDYILAFASIGFMGFARKLTKKQTFNVVLGTLIVYASRFLFHWISGLIYFVDNSIWVDLPSWALSNAALYSFIYQSVYIPADCAICAVVLYLLAKFKVLDRLITIIRPKKKAQTVAQTEEAIPLQTENETATVTETTPPENKNE